jgi:hypothetical protein
MDAPTSSTGLNVLVYQGGLANVFSVQSFNMGPGRPTAELIKHFFGELNKWPTQPEGHNHTQAQIVAYCEHMSQTGDCLWHSMAVVKNQLATCQCAVCMPGPLNKKK